MIRWKGTYIPYDHFAYMQLLFEEEFNNKKRVLALNSNRKRIKDENPLSL